MVSIDSLKLEKKLNLLNNTIRRYEVIQQNLFNNLKNSCIDWNDGNSIIFEKKIMDEKKQSMFFLQNLEKIHYIYKYIYEKYKVIGNNVFFELRNKQIVLNKINSLLNETDNLIKKINSVLNYDIPDEKYEKLYKKIIVQKENIVCTYNAIKKIKNKIIKMYDNLAEIEVNIKNKINKIERIKVDTFVFDAN